MKSSALCTGAAFAGATQFLVCALLPLIGIDAIAPLGRVDTLASSYAPAIICFLAGSHWSTYLLREADCWFACSIDLLLTLFGVE